MLLGITGSGVEINVVSIEASGISLIEIFSISIQQSPALTNQRALFHGLQGSEVTDCQLNIDG